MRFESLSSFPKFYAPCKRLTSLHPSDLCTHWLTASCLFVSFLYTCPHPGPHSPGQRPWCHLALLPSGSMCGPLGSYIFSLTLTAFFFFFCKILKETFFKTKFSSFQADERLGSCGEGSLGCQSLPSSKGWVRKQSLKSGFMWKENHNAGDCFFHT